jgi:hypothetical protein
MLSADHVTEPAMHRLAPPARRLALALALLVGIVATLACGGDDSSGPQTIVEVSLVQFAVNVDRNVVPSGQVTFDVVNDGSVPHEFLVVRTELAPSALPTEASGAYEENGPGTVLVGGVEDMDPGVRRVVQLDLSAGHYVLLCNMVGPLGAHYQLGMRTALTVD